MRNSEAPPTLETIYSPVLRSDQRRSLNVHEPISNLAYNQTGQSLFQQLTVYNSMSSHLRRVLLAKSVVDARGKCCTGVRRNEREVDKRSTFLQEEIPDAIIEKLAYDTRHHPADLIKMSLDTKCTSDRRATEFGQCFSEQRIRGNRPRVTCCRSKKSSSDPNHRNPLRPIVACTKKSKSTETRSPPKSEDYFSGQRYEEDFEESDSDVLTSGTTNRGSTISGSSRSYADDQRHRRRPNRAETETATSRRTEEARYAGFVYEITKEIMRDGLYRDEELKDVFKRHLERNKGVLDMVRDLRPPSNVKAAGVEAFYSLGNICRNKMLHEIYQLKISLNIINDPDGNDDLEELIEAQQLLRMSEIRPPTPPKVLDDDKIMEKLRSYQRNPGDRRSSIGGKSVVLVDPNPELLITEKDILLSLMEAEVEPRQAQRICRSLFHRSRNAVSGDTVEGKHAENKREKIERAVDTPEERRNNEETRRKEEESGRNEEETRRN